MADALTTEKTPSLIYRLELALPSPSLNKYTAAMSPFSEARDKKKWYWVIRAAPGFIDVPKAKGKRHLLIQRYGKGKPLDPDNLIGGAKCVIIDNLKDMGLIVDDSSKWLTLDAENMQLPKGESSHTVLYLKDVP
jgi:hypothetical protein